MQADPQSPPFFCHSILSLTNCNLSFHSFHVSSCVLPFSSFPLPHSLLLHCIQFFPHLIICPVQLYFLLLITSTLCFLSLTILSTFLFCTISIHHIFSILCIDHISKAPSLFLSPIVHATAPYNIIIQHSAKCNV